MAAPPDPRPRGKTPKPAPIRQDLPERPAWARRLDRWSLRAARLLRRVLPRPPEAGLEALARRDRGPKPEIAVPDIPGIDRARQAFAEGRYGEALHLYGEILAADPESPWAWHGRGDALQLLDRPGDALAAYERACALAPRVGLHHGGRGNALQALGRSTEAEEAWRRALALDPSLQWMRQGRQPPG